MTNRNRGGASVPGFPAYPSETMLGMAERQRINEYLFSMPEYNPDSSRPCKACGHACRHRYEAWDPNIELNAVSECAACIRESRLPGCRETDRFLADLQSLIRALQDELRTRPTPEE